MANLSIDLVPLVGHNDVSKVDVVGDAIVVKISTLVVEVVEPITFDNVENVEIAYDVIQAGQGFADQNNYEQMVSMVDHDKVLTGYAMRNDIAKLNRVGIQLENLDALAQVINAYQNVVNGLEKEHCKSIKRAVVFIYLIDHVEQAKQLHYMVLVASIIAKLVGDSIPKKTFVVG